MAFLLLAGLAAAGEVREIAAAIRAGQLPASIIETGQRTNPIHVLDLCFLLPAVVTVAILLLRRKPIGFTLAPAVMVTLVLVSLEVLTIMAVFRSKGLPTSPEPVISFGICAVVLTVLLVWFLRSTAAAARETDGAL